MIDELYEEGQLIEANITRLTKFGAFARLNDQYGLEGLIHISELSDGHVEHPREVVKSSDNVTVRIIRIDPDQRQLGLSLKQVASAEYMEADFSLSSRRIKLYTVPGCQLPSGARPVQTIIKRC
jgi:small subunit ribosomal protein S1